MGHRLIKCVVTRYVIIRFYLCFHIFFSTPNRNSFEMHVDLSINIGGTRPIVRIVRIEFLNFYMTHSSHNNVPTMLTSIDFS